MEKHFEKQVNTEFPYEAATLDEIKVDMSDDSVEQNITEDEITKSIKSLKCRKSSEFDNITAGTIKAGGEFMINIYCKIFNKIV